MEELLPRSIWRNGRSGSCLVHGPVLRALLSADSSQGSAWNCVHDCRSCAPDWRAIVRFLGSSIRQNRTQENHDGGKSSRRALVLSNLSGDEGILVTS